MGEMPENEEPCWLLRASRVSKIDDQIQILNYCSLLGGFDWGLLRNIDGTRPRLVPDSGAKYKAQCQGHTVQRNHAVACGGVDMSVIKVIGFVCYRE